MVATASPYGSAGWKAAMLLMSGAGAPASTSPLMANRAMVLLDAPATVPPQGAGSVVVDFQAMTRPNLEVGSEGRHLIDRGAAARPNPPSTMQDHRSA